MQRLCERLLVQEAFTIHRSGKMLVPIIDDAHLMPADCLRKLRLLCEDFPHSHNLVLIGQPPLLQSPALSINEEIRSRVTYSVVLPRLAPETIEQFILGQLDRAGLGRNTFTAEALALIVRSGEGLLRRTRNLCLSSLIKGCSSKTLIGAGPSELSREIPSTSLFRSSAAPFIRPCAKLQAPDGAHPIPSADWHRSPTMPAWPFGRSLRLTTPV